MKWIPINFGVLRVTWRGWRTCYFGLLWAQRHDGDAHRALLSISRAEMGMAMHGSYWTFNVFWCRILGSDILHWLRVVNPFSNYPYCPECNSQAPALYDCPVCLGYSGHEHRYMYRTWKRRHAHRQLYLRAREEEPKRWWDKD